MVRRIIKIDEERCNGCGLCATACHEGAIEIINGKAKLAREDYCDGLGDCLPSCPEGAISFEERQALSYNEQAVAASKATCPGSMAKLFSRKEQEKEISASAPSSLMQWPIQIKLMPITAPYYDNANLLIAADCTSYAYASFHKDFMEGRITIIGCPKLDSIDYSEKLREIIVRNNIKSVKVIRMEVPCCGGLEYAVKNALKESGKFIPCSVVTISTDGKILES